MNISKKPPSFFRRPYVREQLFNCIVISAFLALYITFVPSLGVTRKVSTPRGGDGTDRTGAVSSHHAQCSQIGLHTMERGGNAADAVSRRLTVVKSCRFICTVLCS